MSIIKEQLFYYLQTMVLAAGSIFAWFTVIREFQQFYRYEGTLFKVTDCILPNPVTTACFYGAIAFVIATLWSVYILRQQHKRIHERRLFWLLLGGVLFAWFNTGRTIINYYQSVNAGVPPTGCSGQFVDNPYTTPCFIGATIFLIAFGVCVRILWMTTQLHIQNQGKEE